MNNPDQLCQISIVVPVYNGEDFIESCYQNILTQDLEDYKVLFVDNNSSDRSAELIKDISQKDSRVEYRFESKQGVPHARNHGISVSNSKYLYFLDVDDQIFPRALNDMISAFKANPDSEVVFGKMYKSEQSIQDININIPDTPEIIHKPKGYWGLHWFKDLKEVVGPPAFLYRSEVFQKYGLYNVDLNGQEDTALDIKVGMLADSILFIDRYVYLYKKHGGSLSDKQKAQTSLISMMWDRMIKSNIPMTLQYGKSLPQEYYRLLCNTLLSGLVKIPAELNQKKDKLDKLESLRAEMLPYKAPIFYILFNKLYLSTGSVLLRKALLYKLKPIAINKMFKRFLKEN